MPSLLRPPSLSPLLAAAAIIFASFAASAGEAYGQSGEANLHDPAVIEHDGAYYLFSTGRGVPIRRSEDLVRWEVIGRVFEELPEWASQVVPEVRGPWAPDIAHFNGLYHLYYSLSSFGSQRSAIGLATNPTLDPTDPEYTWTDRGEVIRSVPGESTFNAIDPNVVLDEAGVPWLSWGSFWGGIKMRRLERETGLPSPADTTLYSLAARRDPHTSRGPTNDQSIEAPFIVRRGGFYYLFASYDMCCRGMRSSYNIRVGRSPEVTGPYLDEHGVAMTEGGGSVVLAGSGRVLGPGHNAVLVDGEQYYLVHHFYDADNEGRSRLQIRPLQWTDEGWPRAGDPLSWPED